MITNTEGTEEKALQLVNAKMPEQKNVIAEYQGISELANIPELLERGQRIKIEDENQFNEIKEAREIRLDLKRARVAVDNRRKKLKEDIIRKGKAFDGVANILKDMIVPVEKHLDEQENFVTRLEEKRLSAIAEIRSAELKRYGVDTQYYDLRQMSGAGYVQLLESSRLAFESVRATEKKIADEQAQREKAEAEEHEKVKLENERLKAESIKRDKEKAERTKIETEQRAAADAKLKAEQLAKEKAEAEVRKIKDEQERRVHEEHERQEAEKQKQKADALKAFHASDKEKLVDVAVMITAIEFPDVKSAAALQVVARATKMLNETSAYIKTQINKI